MPVKKIAASLTGRCYELRWVRREITGNADGHRADHGHLSRQDVASFAGTTYETFFKTINEWTADGLVAASGKQLAILNKKKLKNIVQ